MTRFLRFNVVGALGIGVQLGAVAALGNGLAVAPELASALGVMLAVVHNFTWHRHWTWGDRDSAHAPLLGAFARFAGANGLFSLAGSVLAAAVLTREFGASVIASNAIAVVVTGLANYWVADHVVFAGSLPATPRFATGLSWAVARASSHVYGLRTSRPPRGRPGLACVRRPAFLSGASDLHGLCRGRPSLTPIQDTGQRRVCSARAARVTFEIDAS